ncbi:MAG: hypothetical protein ACREEM_06300 [Blastocatellia bacterium]
MKRLLWLLTLLAMPGVYAQDAYGQQPRRFVRKAMRQYWLDGQDKPWNDLSYQMAVRIDPSDATGLPGNEISSDDNPPLKYTVGEWKYFSLKQDGQGTYADVEYLVYANTDDPITYRIEIQKNGASPRFKRPGEGMISVSNSSPSRAPISLADLNPILFWDWLKFVLVWIGGVLIFYLLVFRLFFETLLRRGWSVSRAEHSTAALTLLLIIGWAFIVAIALFGWRPNYNWVFGALAGFFVLYLIIVLMSRRREA